MDDEIYIVKGKKRCALINLNTSELRTLPLEKLGLLEKSTRLNVDIPKFLIKDDNICNKELLDIKIKKKTDLNKLYKYIDNRKTYYNVRLICESTNQIQLSYIKSLVLFINKYLYHFGVVIFIPNSYTKSTFIEYFKNYEIFTFEPDNQKKEIYNPSFYVSLKAIHISKENNFFHFSRDTIILNGNKTKWIDHDVFNISKNKIEGCRDCEFRLSCYDKREPYIKDGKYFYKSKCKYEL